MTTLLKMGMAERIRYAYRNESFSGCNRCKENQLCDDCFKTVIKMFPFESWCSVRAGDMMMYPGLDEIFLFLGYSKNQTYFLYHGKIGPFEVSAETFEDFIRKEND